MSLERVQEVNSEIISEPTKEAKSTLSPQSKVGNAQYVPQKGREILNTERVDKREGKPTGVKYNCSLGWKA